MAQHVEGLGAVVGAMDAELQEGDAERDGALMSGRGRMVMQCARSVFFTTASRRCAA